MTNKRNDSPNDTHVPTIYYENRLLKKEGVNNWILYWVVIRDKWLQLFETADNGQRKPQLVKTLELTPRTQCTLVKRRKRRFPFSINNGFGCYYMKCDTELERYHWIFSLLTSALGKPKADLPKAIPKSMIEQEAFKRGPKKENDEQREKTAAYHSRRRQKYDDRNEKRRVRKEAKRNRKLLEENGEALTPTPRRTTDELHRSQKLYPNQNTLREVDSNSHNTKLIELRNENKSLDKSDEMKSTSSDSNVIEVNVLMHPTDDGTITHVSENFGFEPSDDDDESDNEDLNGFNRIEVISCEDDILPNMVMVQASDSDTESTEESSIHSQNSLFPNFGSCNDVSNVEAFENDFLTPKSSRKGFRPIEPAGNKSKGHRILNPISNVKKVQVERPVSPFCIPTPTSPRRPMSPFNPPSSPSRPRSGATDQPRTQFSRFLVPSNTSNA